MKIEKYDDYTLEQLFNRYKKTKTKGSASLAVVVATYMGALSTVAQSENLALERLGVGASLLGTITALHYINQSTKLVTNYSKWVQNSKEYKTVDKLYLYLLKDLSKMLKELDFSESHKMFASYSYLLNSGYLSNEHKFIYSTEYNRFNEHKGSSIIEGKGCCRHIAPVLTDLLKESGYTAYNIGIKLPQEIFVMKNKEKIIESEEFEIDQLDSSTTPNKNSIIERLLTKNKIDHTVVLVTDNTNSIIYDPTNDAFFFIKKNQQVYNYQESVPVDYRARDNRYEKRKIHDLLKPTNEQEFDKILSGYCETVSICKENEDIFEKFYLEHKDLYKDIVDKRKILIKEYRQNNPYKIKEEPLLFFGTPTN